MKWKLDGKSIENTFIDLDEHIVMVNKMYIGDLEKYNIPYSIFSPDAKKCVFIRNGKGSKRKKFNDNDINLIKKDHEEGISYKKLSFKYNCSTRTIYKILKDKY